MPKRFANRGQRTLDGHEERPSPASVITWCPPQVRYVTDDDGRQRRVYGCASCRDEGVIWILPAPPLAIEFCDAAALSRCMECGRCNHLLVSRICPDCRPREAEYYPVHSGRPDRGTHTLCERELEWLLLYRSACFLWRERHAAEVAAAGSHEKWKRQYYAQLFRYIAGLKSLPSHPQVSDLGFTAELAAIRERMAGAR